MASFVLQPCKLRDGRFVPRDSEPMRLDWTGLTKVVAPSRSPHSYQILLSMQADGYVGVIKGEDDGRLSTFFYMGPMRNGDFRSILKKDETIGDRIDSVYRVDEVKWDGKTEEYPSQAARA